MYFIWPLTKKKILRVYLYLKTLRRLFVTRYINMINACDPFPSQYEVENNHDPRQNIYTKISPSFFYLFLSDKVTSSRYVRYVLNILFCKAHIRGKLHLVVICSHIAVLVKFKLETFRLETYHSSTRSSRRVKL